MSGWLQKWLLSRPLQIRPLILLGIIVTTADHVALVAVALMLFGQVIVDCP
jgi:hypothetical protein